MGRVQIWRLSDVERRGFLSKEEFFLALRLVALARLSRPLSVHDACLPTSPRTALTFSKLPVSDAHGVATHFV